MATTSIEDRLLQQLSAHANSKTKAWWENYVKHDTQFLGARMADVRKETHAWYRANLKDTNADAQLDTALRLFTYPDTEMKLAGILMLQEILLPAGHLKPVARQCRLSEIFENESVFDWNVCDWFGVKVLSSLIRQEGKAAAKRFACWRRADYLWKARASLVAFVPLVDDPVFHPFIQPGCATMLKRPERFAKTAAGWILHDLSKQDYRLARRIIDSNLKHFSRESLRNAVKYLDKEERQAIENNWKQLQA